MKKIDFLGYLLVLFCNFFWVLVFTIIPLRKQREYHQDFAKWTLSKIRNYGKPKRIYP